MKNKPKFCRERQHSPKKYDKKSFRTVGRGKRGIKQITACLKGYFKREKCRKKKGKSALEVQSILYPEGSDKRCPVGAGGKELRQAKRHKNPHLSAKYDYIGHFPKKVAKGVRNLLGAYGFKSFMTRDAETNDPKIIEIYVSKGQGEKALELVRDNYE